jgi:hypothetical protein
LDFVIFFCRFGVVGSGRLSSSFGICCSSICVGLMRSSGVDLWFMLVVGVLELVACFGCWVDVGLVKLAVYCLGGLFF